jgi:hypothetical protein
MAWFWSINEDDDVTACLINTARCGHASGTVGGTLLARNIDQTRPHLGELVIGRHTVRGGGNVNLLFFTVEIEHGRDGGSIAESRASRHQPRQPGRRLVQWIVLGIVASICAIAAGCGGWLLAGGDSGEVALPAWMAFVTPAAAAEGNNHVRLEVISEPTGASVTVDRHQRGTTPLTLVVADGVHTLVLKHPEAIDAERQLSIAGDMTVNVSMWLRRPTAMLLKPAYPGATITDAAFLQDGRLALSMANPAESTSSNKRALQEVWIYDPTQASLAQFTTKGLSPRAAKVAVSPDGQHLAYLQSDVESSPANQAHAPLKEIWVASANTNSPPVRVFTLSMPATNSVSGSAGAADVEQVHYMTWTPDGGHLLVTLQLVGTATPNAPAPRSRLLLVDASPEQSTGPGELITLPAQVVSGSYIWAPDGNWVAFLTEAPSGSGGSSFVALCAVDTSARGAVSGFRYVADLGQLSGGLGPLPVAAAAWSPLGDGRLIYAAATPRIAVSNPLGLPTTSGGEPGLFVAAQTGQALTAEEGQRLGSATGLIAPAWSAGDEVNGTSLIALARSDKGNRPLVIRGVDAGSGVPQNLDVVLPSVVGGSGIVAARWDLAHGRLLVLARHDNSSSGLLDYWLVQLQARAGAT